MLRPDRPPPRAVIFGCSGPELDARERRLFVDAKPLGFILFARNCENPGQLRRLVNQLRDAVDRPDAPVLIDQEGGRVMRLKPPRWRAVAPAAVFGRLHEMDAAAGLQAAELNARLLADDLLELGIDVDCTPVLDVPADDGHEVIGDRAYGKDPAAVAALGRAVCRGLLQGGVLPVVKHIPGHGRARADSHQELPVVETPIEELRESDFVPFKSLADAPWAMTAHVRYTAIDEAAPATVSAKLIKEVIRGEIGFSGVLLSDDIGMSALSGSMAERASAAIAAGCDVVLHCSGQLDEMQQMVAAVPPVSAEGLQRLARAAARRQPPGPFNRLQALTRLEALLAKVPVA